MHEGNQKKSISGQGSSSMQNDVNLNVKLLIQPRGWNWGWRLLLGSLGRPNVHVRRLQVQPANRSSQSMPTDQDRRTTFQFCIWYLCAVEQRNLLLLSRFEGHNNVQKLLLLKWPTRELWKTAKLVQLRSLCGENRCYVRLEIFWNFLKLSDFMIAVGSDMGADYASPHAKTELLSSSKSWSVQSDYPFGEFFMKLLIISVRRSCIRLRHNCSGRHVLYVWRQGWLGSARNNSFFQHWNKGMEKVRATEPASIRP